jgi:hypothetical protein
VPEVFTYSNRMEWFLHGVAATGRRTAMDVVTSASSGRLACFRRSVVPVDALAFEQAVTEADHLDVRGFANWCHARMASLAATAVPSKLARIPKTVVSGCMKMG